MYRTMSCRCMCRTGIRSRKNAKHCGPSFSRHASKTMCRVRGSGWTRHCGSRPGGSHSTTAFPLAVKWLLKSVGVSADGGALVGGGVASWADMAAAVHLLAQRRLISVDNGCGQTYYYRNWNLLPLWERETPGEQIDSRNPRALQRVNQQRIPVCADRKTTEVAPFLGSRSFQRRPDVCFLPLGERRTAFAE